MGWTMVPEGRPNTRGGPAPSRVPPPPASLTKRPIIVGTRHLVQQCERRSRTGKFVPVDGWCSYTEIQVVGIQGFVLVRCRNEPGIWFRGLTAPAGRGSIPETPVPARG